MSIQNYPDFSQGDGLLPAIAQDAATGQVLMLAWMSAQSFRETIESGRAVYFSRSRNRLWRKGEESGHTQKVLEVRIDCDCDTILLLVEQTGSACHEGYISCFFRTLTNDGKTEVILPAIDRPSNSLQQAGDWRSGSLADLSV